MRTGNVIRAIPWLLCGSWLSAQTPQTKPLLLQPSVGQVVVVDAYVVDRKGRPITDLRQEEFELFEDRRPMPITAFLAPGNDREGQAGQGKPVARSLGASSNSEPLTVAIYVDRWLLSPSGRKRALDQAAALADLHVAQGARVVVIADEKGLRPLTPLTSDGAVVRGALSRIQGWATVSPGEVDGRNLMETMKAMAEGGSCLCDCLETPISMIRGYAFARASEVRDVGEKLALLSSALQGLQGRKVLIYVSEGLEQRPGVHLYDQLAGICARAAPQTNLSLVYVAMNEYETSDPLREAAARANASRVSFYPIDARGLTSLSSSDLSYQNQRWMPSAANDRIKDANLVNPYRVLAEETGGFAIIRGLDPTSAMKRFDADAQGHYVLGFMPGDADGKTHNLRVQLTAKAQARRNAEIRHRLSYIRAELPARRGQRALSALLFGLEENGLKVDAAVERTGPTSAQVRVNVALPSLTPIPDVLPAEGRLQIVVSFRIAHSEKNAVIVREKDVRYSLTPAEFALDGGRREIIVEVPVTSEGYEFAIGIEDVTSGVSSYIRKALPGA